MLRVGIVAGEASGDYLAADLIRAIKQRCPDVLVEGIGGPSMQAEGCKILFPAEKLAVMGLVEVADRFFELLQIRRQLVDYFIGSPPDVFIGVDAPDFNLGLEQSLHAAGIKTVHYVSPSVWAWRKYRINKIKRCIDLMLILFPFELKIYQQYQVPVVYTGHPLADRIAPLQDKRSARDRLGLPENAKVVAIMPGSRKSELERMLPVFLDTARWCNDQREDIVFISSVLSESAVKYVEQLWAGRKSSGRASFRFEVYRNKAHEVMAAADAALLTSGTVTLEAMLFGLPMVVAYRINWLSYSILRPLIKAEFAALPNLLAGSRIVPEFIQGDCQPERLGEELIRLLQDESVKTSQIKAFESLRATLQLGASAMAADAVLSLSGKTTSL